MSILKVDLHPGILPIQQSAFLRRQIESISTVVRCFREAQYSRMKDRFRTRSLWSPMTGPYGAPDSPPPSFCCLVDLPKVPKKDSRG